MINLPNIYRDTCFAVDETLVLILKPGLSYMAVGQTIQFSTFLRNDDGEEVVSTDLAYASSDATKVSINAGTGLATVVAVGHVIISVQHDGEAAYADVHAVAADA